MSNYTITLKTYHPEAKIAGFYSGSIVISNVKYGDTLLQHMNNLNQYRSPDSQIKMLYNSIGEAIDVSLWKLKMTDNLILYIDYR